MGQLQADYEQLKAKGVAVVGVSPDTVDILKTFSDSAAIEFPLLADESSKTIHAYGLHNESGLPHPGTILVGADGKVRAKLFLDGYRDRHSTDDLMQAIDAAGE